MHATASENVQFHPAGMSWTGLAALVWDPSGGDEPQNDHDFILRLLVANPGPALDVGCGTGRLLLRYQAAGFDVDGIDTSADMLDICRQKAAERGLPAPRLYQQAMQEMRLPRRYRTIFVPCGTLVLITDREQALEALRRFYSHLEPGGTVVISAFWPRQEGEALDPKANSGDWNPLFSTDLPDGRQMVQHIRRTSVDVAEQVFTAERRYRLMAGDTLLQEEIFASNERWYFKHELALMLENAGFESVQIKGNYTDDDFDPEQHYVMVGIGRRPQAPASPTAIPVLESERLIVRPLEPADLADVHQVYRDTGWHDGEADAELLAYHRRWLAWSVLSADMLATMGQPAYGDRAVIRKSDGRLVGLVGLVPAVGPFGLLPYYQALGYPASDQLLPEFGLFWATRRDERGQGYAVEAARLLIDYCFQNLHFKRLIATTTDDNTASSAVMRRLGMHIERNPLPQPEWFQVVGVLENPRG